MVGDERGKRNLKAKFSAIDGAGIGGSGVLLAWARQKSTVNSAS